MPPPLDAVGIGWCVLVADSCLQQACWRVRRHQVGGRTGSVTLTFCTELSAAGWIARSDLPWTQLVCFGPAGFDAYARLRFLPDSVRPGQPEHEAQRGERTAQLPTLLEVLATQTTTPQDCYFCVWEGFGAAELVVDDDAVYIDDEAAEASLERAAARPGVARRSADSPLLAQAPKVVVPNRAYWLFRGPLADVGTWDVAQGWPDQQRLADAEPAFVWPADRAWCIANDVDPHYAGIGASSAAIERLLAHPGLDAVLADPQAPQPRYN